MVSNLLLVDANSMAVCSSFPQIKTAQLTLKTATTDSSSDLFSLYLTVSKCEVTFCKFINNKIPGSHIKVNEYFTSNPDGLKLLNSNSNLTAISVSINHCTFESSDCSLFYSNNFK